MVAPARDLEAAPEVGDPASHRPQTEVFGTYEVRVEASAVVGHLHRDGVVIRCEVDRGRGRPGVLDHVGQGFLAEVVQLLFDLRFQGQALFGPVDRDPESLPGAERRRLLGECGDEPLLGQGAGP